MGTGRALTGVGLAVITTAIVAALLANTSNPPSGQSASPELHLPAALAGTPLIAVTRGPAAVAEVNRLHGVGLDLADAAVARYATGIAVWISASPSPPGASALLWRMNRRLASGTPVFTAPRPETLHGRTVFLTEGMAQRHYYYQSGRYVLWVSAPADAAARAVEDLLTLYP